MLTSSALRARTRRAFSILEAVVTMVLIAIATAVAIPTFATVTAKSNTTQARAAGFDYSQRASGIAAAAEGDTANPRKVTFLNQAATNFHVNAAFAGITDGNGDGIDDDGKVSFTWSGASVCVAFPAEPYVPATLTDGACA